MKNPLNSGSDIDSGSSADSSSSETSRTKTTELNPKEPGPKEPGPKEPGPKQAEPTSVPALNVLGSKLEHCCFDPMTGFFRDGYCHTGPYDMGSHTVCARMTKAFLNFTKNQGNDLSTPMPDYDFPGLKPGDFWCLCAKRWKEAEIAGCAPPVKLASCHQLALRQVSLEDLQRYAIGEEGASQSLSAG